MAGNSDQAAAGGMQDYAGRGINRARAEAIRTHGGHSLLDVGCGNGAYVLAFGGERAMTGVDATAYPGWSRLPGAFACADAARLPFADGSFDTVTAFEVLEHLEDPEAALREFGRVCSRNIIITVPDCTTSDGMRRSGLAFHHWVDRSHVNFWDREGIVALVGKCGFDLVAVDAINFINPGHLLAESMFLRGPLAALAARLFRLILWRRYPMTTLVIAVPRLDTLARRSDAPLRV
jgi:SAM-dependent methyltransferase